jgi:Holliday junction resolvasome RuvABC endonuclease subunit
MSDKANLYYMGIDPGESGGVALIPVLPTDQRLAEVFKIPETEHETAKLLREFGARTVVCYIEKVHSMPKQGVVSSFKFGRSYGFLRGLMVALSIPFDEVTPQRWQKDLVCLSRGDKNVTNAKAQQLYPALVMKITHATADALLIATWGRNFERGYYAK